MAVWQWEDSHEATQVEARAEGVEDENARLKRLLAEAMLDNAMLMDVASKKW